MINLQKVIEVTAARRQPSGNFYAFCPLHEGKKRTLVINVTKKNPGIIHNFHCFNCQQAKEIYEYFSKPEYLCNPSEENVVNELSYPLQKNDAAKVSSNLNISEYQKKLKPANNATRMYFMTRGLEDFNYMQALTQIEVEESGSYYEEGKKLSDQYDIIHFPVTIGDELITYQRIYTKNGIKADVPSPKKALSSFSGGAYKVFDDEESTVLHLCEGPETAIAIYCALEQPTWSAICKDNLSNQNIPKRVDEIHIWADLDHSNVGKNAALKAKKIFEENGVVVIIHLPTPKEVSSPKSYDWLDVFVDIGKETIFKSYLDSKVELTKELGIITFSDVKPKNAKFLWEPYIPCGMLTIIEGDPGQGKSQIALSIAAAISKGGIILDNRFDSGTVFGLFPEDDLQITVANRLSKLDANLENIKTTTIDLLFNDEGKRKFKLLIREIKPTLVIIDPIVASLDSSTDMNKAIDVRQVMQYLKNIASEFKCAILIVRHLRKSAGEKAIYRGYGSIDFTAAARSVLMVDTLPQDKNIKLFDHIKCNIAAHGKAIKFSLGPHGVIWEEYSDQRIDDFEKYVNDKAKVSKNEEATEFLEEILKESDIPSEEVTTLAKERGIALKTLERARKTLQVKTKKNKKGKWVLSKLNSREDNSTIDLS